LPQALQLPLLCLGTCSFGEGDGEKQTTDLFTRAVRSAILFGGCSSSRALFVGACSAALARVHPPDSWLQHFEGSKRIELLGLANTLALCGTKKDIQ